MVFQWKKPVLFSKGVYLYIYMKAHLITVWVCVPVYQAYNMMAVEQMKFIQQEQHKKFFATNLFTGIAI